MPNASITTACCVTGGGPAGMMLGFLLARAGVDVVVLEKHANFFRDFSGDTIHPSTLELMYELGLLDRFLKVPHQKLERLAIQVGDTRLQMLDLTHLPTHCKYIALMPQWDFLNFLAECGKRYKTFHVRMETEATDLIEENGRVVGVRASGPDGELAIRADLVVAADGRHSTLRARAGLQGYDYGAPMDVLWFRLTRRQTDEPEMFGHIELGAMLIMIDRGDYWQCAFVIPKGGMERVRAGGLDAFRARVVEMSAYLADRINELKNWDDIKLLNRWLYPFRSAAHQRAEKQVYRRVSWPDEQASGLWSERQLSEANPCRDGRRVQSGYCVRVQLALQIPGLLGRSSKVPVL